MKKQNIKTFMLIILYTIGIIFFFIHLSDVTKLIKSFITVINPIIYGIILAYLLNYPFKLFHNKVFYKMGTKHKWLKKLKFPLSIILTYVLIFGIITFLISSLIPELYSSVTKFIDNIPAYEQTVHGWANDIAEFVKGSTGYDLYEASTYNKIVEMLTGSQTTDFLTDLLSTIIPSAFSAMLGIGTGLYNWILGIIISVYLLAGKDKLLSQARRLIAAYTPEKFSTRFFHICTVFNVKCGKFIIGKIIDSSIIGLMCFIGMSIFRFDYPLLISVIVGVCNMIPFFGPFIGAIPSSILLLLINPMEAVWFIVFIIVLQQFDGNILGPKILGESVGVSGFWIMVSVIVGGGLFGVVGMLLGVPIFAAIYTLLSEGVERRTLLKEQKSAETEPADAEAPKAEEAPAPVQKDIQ